MLESRWTEISSSVLCGRANVDFWQGCYCCCSISMVHTLLIVHLERHRDTISSSGNERLNSTRHHILCWERVRMINVKKWSCSIPAGLATHIAFSTDPKCLGIISAKLLTVSRLLHFTWKRGHLSLRRSSRPGTSLQKTTPFFFFCLLQQSRSDGLSVAILALKDLCL